MNWVKQFAAMVGLGFAGWSVVLSIVRGSPTLFIPSSSVGYENAFYLFGAILGWMTIYLLLGLSLFFALKRLYRRSKKT